MEYGIYVGQPTYAENLEKWKISSLQASLELHYWVKGNYILVDTEPISLEKEHAITHSPHEKIEVSQRYFQNYHFFTHKTYFLHPNMESTSSEKNGIGEPSSFEIQIWEGGIVRRDFAWISRLAWEYMWSNMCG